MKRGDPVTAGALRGVVILPTGHHRVPSVIVRWADATVGIYPVGAFRWRRAQRAWELLEDPHEPGLRRP